MKALYAATAALVVVATGILPAAAATASTSAAAANPAGAAAATGAATATDVVTPPGSDTQSTAGLNYVALGDSYSAGFGLIPYSDLPAAGCYQADANYPHLVAAALELTLDDRTCSGAETANIRDTPQPTITGKGTAPVQSLALNADTNIVTVTIGGNDLGFADIAAFCIANSPTGPLLSDTFDNCRARYVQTAVIGGKPVEIDQLADYIDSTVAPHLDETFAQIATEAPNAKVFVIGYPTLSPDRANVPAGGCFSPALSASMPYPENAFPFTDVDTAYLHGTEDRLNKAIAASAAQNGATYIDTTADTNAHSACAPAAEAYINGISLITPDQGQGTPTGLPGLLVKLGALHPNTAGVAYLASTVGDAITSAVGSTPAPTPTSTTSPAPSPVPTVPGSTSTAVPVPPGSGSGATSVGHLAATGTDLQPILLAGLLALLAGAVGLLVPTLHRARR